MDNDSGVTEVQKSRCPKCYGELYWSSAGKWVHLRVNRCG